MKTVGIPSMPERRLHRQTHIENAGPPGLTTAARAQLDPTAHAGYQSMDLRLLFIAQLGEIGMPEAFLRAGRADMKLPLVVRSEPLQRRGAARQHRRQIDFGLQPFLVSVAEEVGGEARVVKRKVRQTRTERQPPRKVQGTEIVCLHNGKRFQVDVDALDLDAHAGFAQQGDEVEQASASKGLELVVSSR